ncbi:hypothetical protein V3M52_01070 [Trueperella pyogenes]|uniref:hypothetical protein n=1 Tax=Trueperella pyogenes TaxID=1661 RepID=UPI00345E04AF
MRRDLAGSGGEAPVVKAPQLLVMGGGAVQVIGCDIPDIFSFASLAYETPAVVAGQAVDPNRQANS